MFESFPILETERLTLRALVPEDAPTIYTLFSDPEVTRFHGTSTFTEAKQADDFINLCTSRYAMKTGIRWGLVLKETGALIGTGGFNSIVQHRGVIGYDLARDHWGKGYIPEAVQAMVQLGFDTGLHRMHALVMPGNHASMRVLEKLGFVHEGTLRGWYFWEGRYWDMLSFSLLQDDVPSRAKTASVSLLPS